MNFFSQGSQNFCSPAPSPVSRTTGHFWHPGTIWSGSFPHSAWFQLFYLHGDGLNSVRVTKADRKAWEMWRLLFIFSICPVSVAWHSKIVALDCFEILLPFCTNTWLGKGRLSPMTARFTLVIHPAYFHLGPFLSWNPPHHTVKTKQLFFLLSQFSVLECNGPCRDISTLRAT